MKLGVRGDGVAFLSLDISQEDGEKGEGWFWLLQPKRGSREQLRWGDRCHLENMSVLVEVGWIGRKQGVGYRCAVSMAVAVLEVVE